MAINFGRGETGEHILWKKAAQLRKKKKEKQLKKKIMRKNLTNKIKLQII